MTIFLTVKTETCNHTLEATETAVLWEFEGLILFLPSRRVW